MNLIFRIGVNIVRKNMAKHDKKVKDSLPKVNKVNKYLSLNYTNNDKDEFRKFNIYKPESENKNLPLIIDIHGGGWVYGDKDLNDEYASYLASKGYNVVTFSYRLLTMTNLKGMVNDIFTFFNHIYKNKDLYKLSFDNVMISGDSAGGRVQHEITRSKYRISGNKLPAQQAADPGLQFLQGKGLGEIVICPQIQPRHPIGQLGPGR